MQSQLSFSRSIAPKISPSIELYEVDSSISVIDKATINAMYKSVATGPLYVHTKFETI